MRKLSAVSLGIAVAVLLAACSGSDTANVDDADGSISGGNDDDATAENPGSDASSASPDANAGSGGDGSAPNTDGGDSSTSSDAGDAASDAGSDSGSVDAGKDSGPSCVGVCVPGQTRNVTCGTFCGTYVETCSATCTWQQTTNCASPGDCTNGEVEESAVGCNAGEVKTRTCDATCAFGAYSACGAKKSGWYRVPQHGQPHNQDHSPIWTGSELYVIGGVQPVAAYSTFVAAYDPSTTTWRFPAQLPEGARPSVVAWSGAALYVWGTINGNGFVYDPGADSWTKLPTAPALGGPVQGTWSPATSELVMWSSAAGAAYSPATGKWRNTATPMCDVIGAAPQVIAGKLVAFGSSCVATYDPVQDTWTSAGTPTMSANRTSSAGAASSSTTAYLWGGNVVALSVRGLSFSPGDATSKLLPNDAALPTATRYDPGVFFGAGKLFVWGGLDSSLNQLKDLAAYTPGGAWSAMPDAPYSLKYFTTTWDGQEAIFWGYSAADPTGYVASAGGLLYRP